MALTATVDADHAAVLLVADYSAEVGTFTTVTVTRINADGTRHIVRGGSDAALLGGVLYLYDAEAPLDEAVTYEAVSGPTVVTFTDGPVTVDSMGYVWFKDPNRPWANFRLDFCSQTGFPCPVVMDPISLVKFGDKVRAADTNLPGILNNEHPADIYARRKDHTTDITFATKTLAAIDTVYDLFTVGGPILIQAPAVYGWPDHYYQPGDLAENHLGVDQRKPWRLWNVPLTAVDRPDPTAPPQGTVCATWCLVNDTFATYTAMTATGVTWGDLLDGGAPLC